MSSTALATRVVPGDDAFLLALRRYFLVIAPAHLIWEFVHMPLYTIWRTGSVGEIVFAAVHCTGGDLLIASSALLVALLVAGSGWPHEARAMRRVAALTVALGVLYTMFSEWLNIVVRQAWAYSDLMPVVPPFDTGLSPLLQWFVIPSAGLWWAVRPMRRVHGVRS